MQFGYIKGRVYTSDAQIPIENAALSVYQNGNDGDNLLGVRLTDAQGNTTVIPIEAPDKYLSENKGNTDPFAIVNLRIDHPEYKTVYVSGVQIFSGQVSIQVVAMQPVDRNIPADSRAERFDVLKQNL